MSAIAQVDRALRDTGTFLCLECGKCTATCPIARHEDGYSPRRILGMARDGDEAVLADEAIWSCLACGMCEARCPVDIEFTELLCRLRAEAAPSGASRPVCNHGGALQSMMRLMGSPDLHPNRLDWVDDGLQVAEEGDVLLFVGCLPYFDVFFDDLEIDTLRIARSAVRILNRAGIVPALLREERCCGHDLLWNGDPEGYRRLAELNAAAIEAAGAKTVVTTCAECYRTLAVDYPRLLGKPAWRVRHISEVLAELIADGTLALEAPEQGDGGQQGSRARSDGDPGDAATERLVTYQDPCRLGRHMGVFDAPRQVLGAIGGLRTVEMTRSRERAECCGTSAWIACDRTSKRMQDERLRNAAATGAATLVTCCPKCLIHLKCALKDDSLAATAGVEIEDLSVLAAESMTEVHHAPKQ